MEVLLGELINRWTHLMQYHRDKEYMTYVGHLIQHPKGFKNGRIPHLIHSTIVGTLTLRLYQL